MTKQSIGEKGKKEIYIGHERSIRFGLLLLQYRLHGFGNSMGYVPLEVFTAGSIFQALDQSAILFNYHEEKSYGRSGVIHIATLSCSIL